MNRINLAKSIFATRNFVSWGKSTNTKETASWIQAANNNAGPLVFGALLIVCSLAIGCSSDKPKPVSSISPAPMAQPSNPIVAYNPPAAPVTEAKPVTKKVIKKRPATVTYTDKSYGVSFDYPRRYAIETGDAVKELLVSSPVPMNFVQPGGVALAAVELPETGFANTDFDSAFFNVSVNKTLTEEQCAEFSVPQPSPVAQTPSADASSHSETASSDPQYAKLLIGDMELRAAEAVSGEGTRQSDSKYFHVFQNGACYEFALDVNTNAQPDGLIKHIDRDKVFARLEKILSTVKIETIASQSEQTAAVSIDADKAGEQQKSDTAKTNEQKADAVKTNTGNSTMPNTDTGKAADNPDSTSNAAANAPTPQAASVTEATPAAPASTQVPPQ